MPTPRTITRLLVEISAGRKESLPQLLPVVYDELRRLADRYLRRERPDHTLQPTALVHEAYLRLIDQHEVTWQNRAHFFGICARAMREILIEHARARRAAKRGSGQDLRLTVIGEVSEQQPMSPIDLLALDQALERLGAVDPEQVRLVELRFFGGLTVDEVAEVLQVSERTVQREWRIAQAWLFNELSSGDGEHTSGPGGAGQPRPPS